MQVNRIPILILVMSIVYIFIIPSEPGNFKLFFKIIPMLLIIIYAMNQMPRQRSSTHWLVIIGLIFCIIGDGTLRWFIIGLTFFLVGHLFYLTAFSLQWKFSWYRFLMIIPLAILGFLMGNELIQAIASSGDEIFVLPVISYIAVITSMAWLAIMTGNKFAIIGSLLFLISDAILSWNMFISPVPYSHVLIMTTYYAAQFLIAHSISSVVKQSSRMVW
ncbi:lysoplasmalogenase [Virgibacillus salexigens]|uniref:YhhN-like protein n=2 Tax=Virgibacillus TaxID=84406 RepID=A0A024Q7A8_9BACI|nr:MULTISPECIES: lysoplasmalogenase [Virgibacillus]MYL41101.1 lysoplasmalogenase [Virgibacillus massiliensis]GGJ54286.1 membrane protein [Virgibacillus kapii]CDQ38095.1 YhhN-like protein [Virgibacillus massiliensis]